MPPKKTSTRLDITLPDTLVKKIRAHADEREITVSGLIGEAVRSYLEGGSTPSSHGPVMLSPDIDALIQERVNLAVEETLSRLPGAPGPAPAPIQPVQPIRMVRTPSVKTGKAVVPEDIRERMQRYTAATLARGINEACNPDNDPDVRLITRGTLQGFVKGTAKTTDPEYLEQILRGLEYLEKLGSE